MQTKRIGDILRINGHISLDKLQKALSIQAKYASRPMLGQIMLDNNWITKENLEKALIELNNEYDTSLVIFKLLLVTLFSTGVLFLTSFFFYPVENIKLFGIYNVSVVLAILYLYFLTRHWKLQAR